MISENIVTTAVMPLRQIANKQILIGKLTVEQIVSIIRYTDRKIIALDPIEDGSNLELLDKQYYQRLKDSDRTYKIKLFILKQLYNMYSFAKNQISPLALFPSAIILGCSSDETVKDVHDLERVIRVNNEERVPTEVALILDNHIHIAKGDTTLVVDGQHRIAGVEALFNEALKGEIILKKPDREVYQNIMPPSEFIIKALKEFEFLVTFLIDFDRYEQAELFANVNFNQKPVNRSFYYDIFGTTQRGRTLEKLLHDLTAHLNYNASSPLKDKVKMLGSGPGYFSQAFFVEALIPHFRKGTFFSIFVDYQEKGDKYKLLPKFFRAYFSAFFKTFSSHYPDSILVKTTGMGAVIALIPTIYARLKEYSPKPLESDEKAIEDNIIKILSPLSDESNHYFGSDSMFSKGAGKGMQSKLYQKMQQDLLKGAE